MDAVLTFREHDHSYWYEGRRLPGVTEVLEPLQSFAGIPPNVLEAKARLGRVVHACTALHDTGDLDESSVAESAVPYLEAWRSFRRFMPDLEFTLIEKPLASLHFGFAGTPDRLGLQGDQPWVLDIKCTAVIAPVVSVQLCAYGKLADECHFNNDPRAKKPTRYAAIQLKPNGKYVFDERADAHVHWTLFRSLINVANWKAKHHVN